MAVNKDLMSEINLLIKFPSDSAQQGLKIHSDADNETISAAERLFHKGLISQLDGGYLTISGHNAADLASGLISTLTPTIN